MQDEYLKQLVNTTIKSMEYGEEGSAVQFRFELVVQHLGANMSMYQHLGNEAQTGYLLMLIMRHFLEQE